MTVYNVLLFAVLSFFAAFQSMAGSVTFDKAPKIQTWKNDPTNCQASGTCDLKSVSLAVRGWVADYSDLYGPGSFNYGDTMTFSFETDTVAALENYVVVQHVQGCVYDSWMENGVEKVNFRYSRKVIGQSKTWLNEGWQIDTDDEDPAYNSPYAQDYAKMKQPSRQGWYRWNAIADAPTNNVPDSRETETEFYYGLQYPPLHPILYVNDRAGSAFMEKNTTTPDGAVADIAKNISLEFRTCLHKSSDVTTSITDAKDTSGVKNEIVCLDWSTRHVYNWQTKKYEKPKTMSPVCLSSAATGEVAP